MKNYKHILVAVEVADESRQVVNRAMELVGKDDAMLTLMHVVEYVELAYPGELTSANDIEVQRALESRARRWLDELGDEIGLNAVNKVVEAGAPKREIVRFAAENSVDLIVLGSHGKHGLQLLLGSTADGVLHLAPCDVLAVRIGG